MKKTFCILIQAALLTTGCCNTPADDPLSRTSDMAGWSIDVVAPGCVWYNYTGFYLPTGANQTINVLEIDLSYTAKRPIRFRHSPSARTPSPGSTAPISNPTYRS